MFSDPYAPRLFSTSPSYIMMKTAVEKPNTFLYFSYGANILTFRMHMHSPNAEFIAIARLDNYRLDFIKYCSFWGGPTATLVPTANGHVWGVIWRLHKDDMEKLDANKGVDVKKYYVKNVRVLSQCMGYFTARVYIQKINPLPRGDNDPIPIEYWPSWTYKEIMVMGATEHNFPEYYIKQLKNIEDNGEEGALRTGHQLDFLLYSGKWRGAAATIVPMDSAHVWGAVWRLHVRDLRALDKQEGVDTNRYFARTVEIVTLDGHKVQCRVYQQTNNPSPLRPGEELPPERRPSSTYLDCIVNGAKECKLPSSYILDLMKIPHNGQTASPEMLEMLNC